MIPGDPRYDPAARRKKIADLKVQTCNCKQPQSVTTDGRYGNGLTIEKKNGQFILHLDYRKSSKPTPSPHLSINPPPLRD